MATISEAFAIAVQHHQAGQLQTAEQIYRQILAVDPNHADALHLLGVIAFQTGKYELAVECFARAIELNSTQSVLHCSLGSVFRAQGNLDDAAACFRRALEIKPDDSEAHNNLGHIYQAQCKHGEAVASFRRALELKADGADVHSSLGNAFQAQGKFDEAVESYRHALELKPNDAITYNNLANALQGLGKLDEAIDSYRRALELKPDFAEVHNNIGNAFLAQGRLDEAIVCCRRALELRPDDAEASCNLGNAFHAQGKLDEAVAFYRRALNLQPDLAEVHNDMGNALWIQGKLDEAFGAYRRAVELNPDYPDAQINLGTALHAQGRLEQAVACFHRALELKPDLPGAHNNLGNVLRAQGKLDEAIDSYRRALALKPDFAEAYNNLGNIFLICSRFDEAVASYDRAIDLRPDFADVYKNLAPALQGQGRCDEAVQSCRRAVELKPNDAGAFINLAHALKDQGRIDEAISCFRRALEVDPWSYLAHSGLVFTLCYSRSYEMAAIYEEHKKWYGKWAAPLAIEIPAHTNDRTPSRRLRVGYVSSAFRNHSASLFALPLLKSHYHEQFEIVCYSDVIHQDTFTSQHQACADYWRNIVGLSDEQVAETVRRDEIDILVDLTMHMERGRLLVFARKPAPVQVCWLAYPGTTGLKTIDYRLTDPHLDPPGLNDQYYSEQSYRLPDSFWCYDPLSNGPMVNSLPAAKNGYITFGCLNNFCKINAGVLELWAGVLKAVERSKLLLLAPEGAARQNVLQVLGATGISTDRISFVARQPRLSYLELYHQIDIGLDTLPYNGHTTSLDSFWMGVPVVTLVGNRVVGRGGLSQLTNLGLPELIATAPDQFVSIAAELANDRNRLGELRASLRQRLEKSPLMNAARFAGNVEAAYRSMWQRWCDVSRDSFSTQAISKSDS